MKINKVECCQANHLSLATVNRGTHTVRLGYYIPWHDIPLRRGTFASFTQETVRRNGTVYYQIKLEMKTPCGQEVPFVPCAFRLHTIDGKSLVIGTAERPYPMVNTKNSESGNPSEATRYQLSVTWESVHPALLEA